MKVAMTLFIIVALADAKGSIEQYTSLSASFSKIREDFLKNRDSEFDILVDLNLANDQVTERFRTAANDAFQKSFEGQGLEEVLTETSTPLADLIKTEDQLGDFQPFSAEELEQAAVKAASEYSSHGDYHNYDGLTRRFNNMVSGHLLSGHFDGQMFNADFYNKVKAELEGQINKQRNSLTLKEYTLRKEDLKEFLNSQQDSLNSVTSRINNVNGYQLNFVSRLRRAFTVLLIDVYLHPESLTQENFEKLNDRIVAIIKAYFRTAAIQQQDVKSFANNSIKNIWIMAKTLDRDHDAFDKLFANVKAALKESCYYCDFPDRIVV